MESEIIVQDMLTTQYEKEASLRARGAPRTNDSIRKKKIIKRKRGEDY